MGHRTRPRRHLVLLALSSLLFGGLVGCGSGDEGEAGEADPGGGSPSYETVVLQDACDLLGDDEVTATIGPHGPGEQDYLYGGCWWPSTESPPDAVAWGLRVAFGIDEATFEDLADDPGEPVDDIANATYHELDSALWFTCVGAHCVVSAVIDPPEESRAAAESLAGLILERVGK